MICTFFIAVTILRVRRNPYMFRSFLWSSNVPVGFFKFLCTELAACSKPPSRKNYRKTAFTRATFSCENRHLDFFLSQLLLFLSFSIWHKKIKAKCRFSKLKVARVNAASSVLSKDATMWPVEPKPCTHRRRKKRHLYPLGHPADWLRSRKIWLRLRTKSRIGQNLECWKV